MLRQTGGAHSVEAGGEAAEGDLGSGPRRGLALGSDGPDGQRGSCSAGRSTHYSSISETLSGVQVNRIECPSAR